MATTSENERVWPAGEPRAPQLHRAAERLTEVEAIDGPAAAVADKVKQVVPDGPVKDALSGVPLGHTLHPALTDLVVGAWSWAALLDVFGGRGSRQTADRLVACGILASLPTAATGASDWADTVGGTRRLGAFHAIGNSAALTLYSASLIARRRGRRGIGVVLGLAGGAAAVASAHLGGHLSFAHGVGVDHTVFESPPGEWTEAARLEDLQDDQPTAADVEGEAVVLVRRGDRVFALADTCTHRGGSLSGGHLHDGCISCPLHHSTFRLEDGAVVRGPATAPQPAYDVRVRDGAVEVRRA